MSLRAAILRSDCYTDAEASAAVETIERTKTTLAKK